jgi:hypothetical protein
MCVSPSQRSQATRRKVHTQLQIASFRTSTTTFQSATFNDAHAGIQHGRRQGSDPRIGIERQERHGPDDKVMVRLPEGVLRTQRRNFRLSRSTPRRSDDQIERKELLITL